MIDEGTPRISRMVKRLLPDASLELQLEAQTDLDGFIAALYRICERMEREEEDARRDNAVEDATVDTPSHNV